MKLSFDLDGVIADTDTSMLSLLHRAARSKLPGAGEDLLLYYARRHVLLDPREFAGEADSVYVVTGRVPSTHAVTLRWVQRKLGLSQSNLFLVGSDESERLYQEGHSTQAVQLLAKQKLRAIRDIGADVHFDNNPGIVETLRKAGVIAIQVGPGIM